MKEEVFNPGFLESLPSLSYEARQPRIELQRMDLILSEFKRLRVSDEQIYLRSASINRINGLIGMNFSCDGSHYIECDEFFSRLREFGLVEAPESPNDPLGEIAN